MTSLSWSERLHSADHWIKLDAARAWEQLARLLEETPGLQGNAAVAWMHAATLFRGYTQAWERAGAASRWDPDYRREGSHAAGRAEALHGGSYGLLEPGWLNTLLAGWPEQGLEDALAWCRGGHEPNELTAAGRKILAVYCRAANENGAAMMLDPG